jgi:hypothetical protein
MSKKSKQLVRMTSNIGCMERVIVHGIPLAEAGYLGQTPSLKKTARDI